MGWAISSAAPFPSRSASERVGRDGAAPDPWEGWVRTSATIVGIVLWVKRHLPNWDGSGARDQERKDACVRLGWCAAGVVCAARDWDWSIVSPHSLSCFFLLGLLPPRADVDPPPPSPPLVPFLPLLTRAPPPPLDFVCSTS